MYSQVVGGSVVVSVEVKHYEELPTTGTLIPAGTFSQPFQPPTTGIGTTDFGDFKTAFSPRIKDRALSTGISG